MCNNVLLFLIIFVFVIRSRDAVRVNDTYVYKTVVNHRSSSAEERYETSRGFLKIHVARVLYEQGDRWAVKACASTRRNSLLRGQSYVSDQFVPFRWSSDGDLEVDFSFFDSNSVSSVLESLRFVHPSDLIDSVVTRHESDKHYDWFSSYYQSSVDPFVVVKRNRTRVRSRTYKARFDNSPVDLNRHGTVSMRMNLTNHIPSYVQSFETIDTGPVRIGMTNKNFGETRVRVDSELILELVRVQTDDIQTACPPSSQQQSMIEISRRSHQSNKRQHRRSQQQQQIQHSKKRQQHQEMSSLTNVITPQELINYVSTFASFMILMEGNVVETVNRCAAHAENLRDLALFMLRGMSSEKLETLVDMTFDEVLAFDFGEEPPPSMSEEEEESIERPIDIAIDMQKYKIIGAMTRVDNILGKLEEASRILKTLGTGKEIQASVLASRDDSSVRTGGISIELLQDIYNTLSDFKTALSNAQNNLRNVQGTINDLKEYFDTHVGMLVEPETPTSRREKLNTIKKKIKLDSSQFLEDIKGLTDEISLAARGAVTPIQDLHDKMYKPPTGLQHTLKEHAQRWFDNLEIELYGLDYEKSFGSPTLVEAKFSARTSVMVGRQNGEKVRVHANAGVAIDVSSAFGNSRIFGLDFKPEINSVDGIVEDSLLPSLTVLGHGIMLDFSPPAIVKRTLESLIDGTILNIATNVALPRIVAQTASEIVYEKDLLKSAQWEKWKQDFASNTALLDASVGDGCESFPKEKLNELVKWVADTIVSNIDHTLPPSPPVDVPITNINNADETSRHTPHAHESPLESVLSTLLDDENFCKTQGSVRLFLNVAINFERFRTILHGAFNGEELNNMMVNVVEAGREGRYARVLIKSLEELSQVTSIDLSQLVSGMEATDEFLICTIRTALVRSQQTKSLIQNPEASSSSSSLSSYCDSSHFKTKFKAFASGGAGLEDDLNDQKENQCVAPGSDYIFMRGNFKNLESSRGEKLGRRIGVLMETLFSFPRLLSLGCELRSNIKSFVQSLKNCLSDSMMCTNVKINFDKMIGGVSAIIYDMNKALDGANVKGNHPLRQTIDFADSAFEMIGTILTHVTTGSMNEVDAFGNPVLVCRVGPVMNHVKKPLFHQTIPVLIVSIGPLPVFGIPITATLRLMSYFGLHLNWGQCGNSQDEYFTLAPSVQAKLYASTSVGVGIPMFNVNLGVEVVIVSLELPVQFDINLQNTDAVSAVVQVNPIVESLEGRLFAGADLLGMVFQVTIFKWKGVHFQFRGICKSMTSTSWPACANHLDNEDESSYLIRCPDRNATVWTTCPPQSPEYGQVVTKAYESRPSVSDTCTLCSLTKNVLFKDQWICPLHIDRFEALAGTINLKKAIDVWMELAGFFSTSNSVLGIGAPTRRDIEVVAVCGEQIRYNVPPFDASQGCVKRSTKFVPKSIATYCTWVIIFWHDILRRPTFVRLCIQKDPSCETEPLSYHGEFFSGYHPASNTRSSATSMFKVSNNAPLTLMKDKNGEVIPRLDTRFSVAKLGQFWVEHSVQYKLPSAEPREISSLPGIAIEGSNVDEHSAQEHFEKFRKVLSDKMSVFRATQISSRKYLNSRQSGIWSEASEWALEGRSKLHPNKPYAVVDFNKSKIEERDISAPSVGLVEGPLFNGIVQADVYDASLGENGWIAIRVAISESSCWNLKVQVLRYRKIYSLIEATFKGMHKFPVDASSGNLVRQRRLKIMSEEEAKQAVLMGGFGWLSSDSTVETSVPLLKRMVNMQLMQLGKTFQYTSCDDPMNENKLCLTSTFLRSYNEARRLFQNMLEVDSHITQIGKPLSTSICDYCPVRGQSLSECTYPVSCPGGYKLVTTDVGDPSDNPDTVISLKIKCVDTKLSAFWTGPKTLDTKSSRNTKTDISGLHASEIVIERLFEAMEKESAYINTNQPVKSLLNDILSKTTNFKGKVGGRGVLEHDDCGFCRASTKAKYLQNRRKGVQELFNALFNDKGDVGQFVKESKTLAAFIGRPSVTISPESFEVSPIVFEYLYESTHIINTEASSMSELFKFSSSNQNSGLLEATGQCFACNAVQRKESEVTIMCPRLGRRRASFIRAMTPPNKPLTDPVTASPSKILLDRGVHHMLVGFKKTGLPRAPSSCDFSSELPEGFCCSAEEVWQPRPGLGQRAFEKSAGDCLDTDDNIVTLPSGESDKHVGYSCVLLGHKWVLNGKVTGGQCDDTYSHFMFYKSSNVKCKKGTNPFRNEAVDPKVCATKGGIVDGYCWDRLNDVDGFYLRPGITVRDARASHMDINQPTCKIETCCAGPATTSPKAKEHEELMRPQHLDISTAFLKNEHDNDQYMRTYICDERISFDGFRERKSKFRVKAQQDKQSLLRRLDPCIKCLDDGGSKFCIPSLDGNSHHGFCMKGTTTCGLGYQKVQTKLDMQSKSGPNYSGWIALTKGNDAYFVYFVCEDALMPHSYLNGESIQNGCILFDDTRNIHRRSRFTVTESMLERLLQGRVNEEEVDGSHYLTLIKQNPDQSRDRQIPKMLSKYLEQRDFRMASNKECRPIVRIDPYHRKSNSPTDERVWREFFKTNGVSEMASQDSTTTICVGHSGESELKGHATGRCFWITLNGAGNMLSFDDKEATEVRAVAVGLPPDSNPVNAEETEASRRKQLNHLNEITLAVIKHIRKEHLDGVGGRDINQGQWAVCDERRWIDCESGSRTWVGGMVCYRVGISRSCWLWSIQESSFTSHNIRDLHVSEMKLGRLESINRPWLYFFDRFVGSTVYDPERGERVESEFAIQEVCDRAPPGVV